MFNSVKLAFFSKSCFDELSYENYQQHIVWYLEIFLFFQMLEILERVLLTQKDW